MVGKVTFVISSRMEKNLIVEDCLNGANHTLVMSDHPILHLGDVIFYIMGTLLRKGKPSDHDFQIRGKHLNAVSLVVVGDLFIKMIFFASSLNP